MTQRPLGQQLEYASPDLAPRADLRRIAVRQKAAICCILANLIAVGLRREVPPEWADFARFATVVVIATSAATWFLLRLSIYGIESTVVLGVVLLVPVAAFVALEAVTLAWVVEGVLLFALNGRAADVLRRNGVPVGLLGANMSQIPADPPAGPPP
jgi:hypothetical protein